MEDNTIIYDECKDVDIWMNTYIRPSKGIIIIIGTPKEKEDK